MEQSGAQTLAIESLAAGCDPAAIQSERMEGAISIRPPLVLKMVAFLAPQRNESRKPEGSQDSGGR